MYCFTVICIIAVKVYIAYVLVKLLFFFSTEREKRSIRFSKTFTPNRLLIFKCIFAFVVVLYAFSYCIRIGMLVGTIALAILNKGKANMSNAQSDYLDIHIFLVTFFFPTVNFIILCILTIYFNKMGKIPKNDIAIVKTHTG